MADVDLKAVKNKLVEVARIAGRMIMDSNYQQDFETDTKFNAVDLVTETDKAVEEYISAALRETFPTFSFMGEETFQPGTKVGPEPTFVVDPIDGTTNFIHSFPHACVSLGLAVDRTPTVGVIYNPFLDILYWAIQGQGAFMQTRPGGAAIDRRLPLARTPAPLQGLAKALPGHGGAMVHSLRSLGSAALNLAAVAAGQLDLFWEGGCFAWDVCAGWCILAEAGGLMVSGNPGNWEPALEERVYLAVRAAPSGQREIAEEFWGLTVPNELNFQGFVRSDWGAQHTSIESALNGLDMTMPGDRFGRETGVTNLSGAVRIMAAYYKVHVDDKEERPDHINFHARCLTSSSRCVTDACDIRRTTSPAGQCTLGGFPSYVVRVSNIAHKPPSASRNEGTPPAPRSSYFLCSLPKLLVG
ncbi:unnamed protein product [Parascedosporium putredinis]|uniref:inositol-phosphate phosphatase n=1 Tax=Parascedosporium putredinis TaxID=1442378 RepID=A0A9P1GXI9_9PEZI|nr:unnamed protein product [Parascedosporium putredinis]CAI7990651.1 unnamed protein product [Parascedosporium putredinis]